MAIPMLKIRRPNGRLIFNMEIPYVDKTVFILRRGPGRLCGQDLRQRYKTSFSLRTATFYVLVSDKLGILGNQNIVPVPAKRTWDAWVNDESSKIFNVIAPSKQQNHAHIKWHVLCRW